MPAIKVPRYPDACQDPLTETYNMGFYLQYIAKWPEYCFVADGPTGRSMGYVLGKAEDFQDKPDSWHGHVTAVTVPPEYRRLGMATQLMHVLERGSRTNRRPSHARARATSPRAPPRLAASEHSRGYFVDLFVRKSNALAIGMYSKMGYTVYREVIGYYSGEENAYDMRKPLSRDPEGKSAIPLPAPVYPHDLD